MSQTDVVPVTEQAELTLSVHEVAEICTRLALGIPPAISAGLPPHQPADVQQLLDVVVQRSLLARGILQDTPDGPIVDESVRELVLLLARPGVVVRVDVENEGVLTVHTVYALPDRAVLESSDGSGVLGYRQFDLTNLMSFVIEATGLHSRPAPSGTFTLTVSAMAFASAGEAVERGDLEGARETLVAAGAEGPAAMAYLDAVGQHRVGARCVSTVHRIDDVMTTTVTAWSDCGSAGLWLVEQDDALSLYAGPGGIPRELQEGVRVAPVSVRGATGEDLLDLIEAGLPMGA
jgi:hypothetical protein